MDTTNTSNVTDDQELAKVLESMNQQAGPAVAAPSDTATAEPAVSEPVTTDDGLAFEETGTTTEVEAAEAPVESAAPVEPETVDTPATASAPEPFVSTDAPELDNLKKEALQELRPLVDKLNLPADEKFDTLLLLIRSTDDKTLLSAAHDAAKSIEDENKRAQALLDVIKEIDYFSGHGANPAL